MQVNCAAVFHRDSIESVGAEENVPQFSLHSSTDSSANGSNSAVPHGLSTFDAIMVHLEFINLTILIITPCLLPIGLFAPTQT